MIVVAGAVRTATNKFDNNAGLKTGAPDTTSWNFAVFLSLIF